MTCVELQESLAQSEDGTGFEQQLHLKTCPDCRALVRELSLIAASAVDLRGGDEPSPRVWNSIEATLRREGIIRPTRPSRSLIPSLNSQWAWARWLAPAAALLLITAGLYVHRRTASSPLITSAPQPVVSEPAPDLVAAGLNDDDLLQEAAEQTPAMRAQYEDDLRRVNAYILDAKEVVAANPNDEEARRTLLEAYQEKAMLFELAMDRSLP